MQRKMPTSWQGDFPPSPAGHRALPHGLPLKFFPSFAINSIIPAVFKLSSSITCQEHVVKKVNVQMQFCSSAKETGCNEFITMY